MPTMPATAATSASRMSAWRRVWDHTSTIPAGMSAHDTQLTMRSIEARSSLFASVNLRAAAASSAA